MLTYNVSGTKITKTGDDELTSGMIGKKIKITCTNAWALMTKTVTFRGSNKYCQVDVPVLGPPSTEFEVEIPASVLADTNILQVGMYGTVDGTATPTVWADPKTVNKGAVPSGVISPIPDTLVEQLLTAANNAVITANGVRSDADAGAFRGEKGDTGDTGATGNGITSIVRTSGTGAPGTTDTYTITMSDLTTATFTVTHGTNGTASSILTGLTIPTDGSKIIDSDSVLQGLGKAQGQLNALMSQISQLANLSTMSFKVTDVDTSTQYAFGLQIKDGKTQLMYEEVV